MLYHWLITQTRKAVMEWVLIPFKAQEQFWKTWHDVFRGKK